VPNLTVSKLSAVMAASVLAGCGARHAIVKVPHTDSAAVAVIRAWSTALRHGDVAAAARYFALPSVMVNGPDANGGPVIETIHTRLEARVANASLPCGARFISADRRGRFINALFRLTDRPGVGGGCGSGIGQTARTDFLIRGGRIVEWIRAPDDPGDNAPGPAV
jgi:hypothetical protein